MIQHVSVIGLGKLRGSMVTGMDSHGLKVIGVVQHASYRENSVVEVRAHIPGYQVTEVRRNISFPRPWENKRATNKCLTRGSQ